MDQEQIRIIKSAIGRPRPNVPRIVSANAESIFDAGDALRTNMTLFLKAPHEPAGSTIKLSYSGPSRDVFWLVTEAW